MLRKINIQNVVLIEKQEIEFGSGLNVLSGETGAGKSILLDAIGLVSGSRAESRLVRKNEDKAVISAYFDNDISNILDEHDLESGDELILKRSLKSDGKSKAYINGEPVSKSVLEEVGAEVLEIHSQFETRGLLDEANHVDLLDGRLEDWKIRRLGIAEAYGKLSKIKKELNDKVKLAEEAKREEDYLRHIYDELEQIKYLAGEEQELDEKRRKLKNAGEIIDFYSRLIEALESQEQLGAAQRVLYKSPESEQESANEIDALIEAASENINEAYRMAQGKLSEIEASEDSLEDVEVRLSEIRSLARKHNITPEELPSFYEEVKTKLKLISGNEEEIEALTKDLATSRDEYLKLAQSISKARKVAAKKLEENIHTELVDLKMENARFKVQFDELDENNWNSRGIDKIVFLVSTNKGSDFGSIAKVASGGELSRVMLALKAISASSDEKVIIFDEIDAGIGGATADAVGKRLKKIAKSNQVLVVTHSPQVASYADRHFYIEKFDEGGATYTKVHALSKEESKAELARMISGENVTDEAMAQADRLIKKPA